ncbi:DUF4012 domain-containing protein [uncultured Jatrophihabitans sp.]|uniref:DUF4012 domain-containing protein n=1 Tax=uncultured Jatrophihabitans sp. TaxID=1610747 RepID=UPI0035CC81C5
MYFGLFAAIVGLVGLALIWIIVTGLVARSRLESAQYDVRDLKKAAASGDLAKVQQLSSRIADRSASAHNLTSGPAWWVGANLPLVGTPLHTSRVIARQANRIARTAPPLVTSLRRLTSGHRASSGIDLAAARQALARLAVTGRAVDDAQRAVRATPGSWLPLVSTPRNRVSDQLTSLTPALDQAERATGAVLPMLGDKAPQRYFVGFMNEAEARGLGGLPGAYAILTVDRGKVKFSRFGNDSDFRKVRSGIDLGPEYAARYGQDDPENYFVNSDVSPNFPDAARILAGMWRAKTGQTIDGAVVIDPTALRYLLDVTGPAVLPNGSTVAGNEVVGLTEKDQYSKYAKDADRNAYLNRISAAVAAKLVKSGGAHPVRFLAALHRGVSERRLALWSADPAIERRLVEAGYAADLRNSDAFTGFTVVNAAGSKLDFYLRRSMTYRRAQCTPGSTAVATMTLTNDAPSSGLPPYVTFRADDRAATAKPGDNRLLVTYYASSGATVTSVQVDGRPVATSSGVEQGLPATTIDLELPVQQSRTVTVTLTEPVPQSSLTVLRQPLVKPLTTRISTACDASR